MNGERRWDEIDRCGDCCAESWDGIHWEKLDLSELVGKDVVLHFEVSWWSLVWLPLLSKTSWYEWLVVCPD